MSRFVQPDPSIELDPRVKALEDIADPIKRIVAGAELVAYFTEARRQARAMMGQAFKQVLASENPPTRRELSRLTGIHPTSVGNYMAGQYEK